MTSMGGFIGYKTLKTNFFLEIFGLHLKRDIVTHFVLLKCRINQKENDR